MLFLLLILPLAVGALATSGDNADATATVPPGSPALPPALARVHSAVIAPLRAAARTVLSALAASAPMLPAALMAAAAGVPRLAARLAPRMHLPEAAQWTIGIALLAAASLSAASQHGGGEWLHGEWLHSLVTALRRQPSGTHAPAPLRIEAFSAALTSAAGGADAGASRLREWAAAWAAAPVDEGGPAQKLLLFGESGGVRAAAAVRLLASELMPFRGRVLELVAERDCGGGGSGGGGGCAGRIEAHAAAASTAGERALIVVHHVEACASDALYDDAISAVERFLDPTPDVQITASGAVRKALMGFVLFAPCLSAERCAAVGAADGGAARELIASGELEALWPRASFSPAVNAAKRAFINRIGSDLDVLCG